MRRGRWAGVLLAAVGVLAACGDDEPSASPSTTTDATGSTSTTATADPERFESTQYPYALRLPAGVEDGSWADARQPWDGTQGIDMGGPFVDVVFLPSRSLFLYGATTPDDLEAFVAAVAGIATRRHQCSEPQNRREVMIGVDPAVGFTQSCDEDTLQARVAILHEGFGLVAFSQTVVGEESAALDEVIAALDGLEWRTG